MDEPAVMNALSTEASLGMTRDEPAVMNALSTEASLGTTQMNLQL